MMKEKEKKIEYMFLLFYIIYFRNTFVNFIMFCQEIEFKYYIFILIFLYYNEVIFFFLNQLVYLWFLGFLGKYFMENCILFFLGFEMIGLLVENIIGSEVREFGFIIN